MKKFLIIVIALIVAGASGVSLFVTLNDYVGTGWRQYQPTDNSSMAPSQLGSEPTAENTMMPAPTTASAAASSASPTILISPNDARYLAYAEGVVGNGEASILFFHSSSSLSSTQTDSDLKAIYKAHLAAINTYKVDYDIATALGKKYGVTDPSTLVMLDAEGNVTRTLQGAARADLELLLK